MRLIRDVFYFKGQSKKTSLKEAINYVTRILHKKSIVFIISDFLDKNYKTSLGILAKRHDVIPLVIQDPKEIEWKQHGLMVLEDIESNETLLINTNSKSIVEKYNNIKITEKLNLKRLFKSLNMIPIYIETNKDIFRPLIQYFKFRANKK